MGVMGAAVLAFGMRAPERVAEDFVFAEDGRAKAVIVCAKPDAANIRYAANELADYLGRLTGARFAVVDEPVEGFGSIRIGDEYEAGAPEELHIEVKSGDELVLTGEGRGVRCMRCMICWRDLGVDFISMIMIMCRR